MRRFGRVVGYLLILIGLMLPAGLGGCAVSWAVADYFRVMPADPYAFGFQAGVVSAVIVGLVGGVCILVLERRNRRT